MKTIMMLTILLCLSILHPAIQATDLSHRFEKLDVILDPWAESQIKFWRNVYVLYTSRQAVLHDSMNLTVVYSVVENNPKIIAAEKRKILDALKGIQKSNANRATLTPFEQQVFDAHGAVTDTRIYQFAAENDRIRVQIGQADQLEKAFSTAKRYLGRMEEMLREESVPVEISRLTFVESSFNTHALSSVGALGIWQFMPKTAMRDLRVDTGTSPAIDERRDPLKATRAAAKYLKANYKILSSWSLAIMAYHHGSGLVRRAMQRLHTKDPVAIARSFKDPNYLFASRNYLFEFLAMLDADRMKEAIFKVQDPVPLPVFITVSLPSATSLPDLLKRFQLSDSQVRILNPHFLAPLWTGKRKIPAHYPVRLSGITLDQFRKAFP